MRMIMRCPSIIVGMILLTIALGLAGCRADNSNNSNNANSTANQASAESNTAARPAQTTTPAQATPTQATATPTSGATDSLPVRDAAAFRDRLLEVAENASFNPQKQASDNAYAIREAWERQFPNLKFALFYSMAAAPDTVSSSDYFLISGVSGNFDQLYAFAVADTNGKCAGGAAVIPGDNANNKTSEAKVPTVFKPIDMTNAKSCTGEAAGENYKP
ncbi:MAG: hypothetical protein ICV68_05815 [Pyrinomonadaceae bacterium]|nr:hypothetical protein [Pyrinomonadaceae bacterium]